MEVLKHIKSWRRPIEHLLFWILYWLLLSLYGGLYDSSFAKTGLYILTDMPFLIVLTYLFVYGILPLLFQRKWVLFFAASVVAFGGTVVLKRLFLQYVQFPWLYFDSTYTFTFFNWHKLVGHFVELAATSGFVAGLKYYRDWQRTKDKVEALSAEKRAAELSFLKAQVHPHFLFNTLNSIYYEVLRKSDAAPDLIIRLCDLLRFTLYQCKDPLIPISKEVELIENYIALEQCRYGARLTVAFSVTGETTGMIPPLICFSLIENAFKHGTSENKDRSHIAIQLNVSANRLHLEVQNPIAHAAQPDVLGASKGIGMRNITQQLQLLFGDGYTLVNAANGDQFISTLEMPLQ
jgi:two-component system, LytTR family, sensor kinase